MTIWRRLRELVLALFQLSFVPVLLMNFEIGKNLVLDVMILYLFFNGARYILYYLTMARHMVDGKVVLYKGAIYLDISLFLSIIDPDKLTTAYLMLYVVGYFALCGIYRCLKVVDSRRVADEKWFRLAFIAGWYLLLCAVGIANFRSDKVLIYLFCIEMTMASFARMSRVFRKTAIVYFH